MTDPKVLAIIPARYRSSRYPGKPLVPIAGKPLVLHVAEKAAAALGRESVVVATEDERIRRVVEEAGFGCEMTGDHHPTGTDRVWEVASRRSADVYVNVQGDEPLVHPDDIRKVIALKVQHPDYIINGMCPLGAEEDPANVNLPKVLVNRYQELIYMSRLPIPGIKDPQVGVPVYYKQVCIYAFSRAELAAYGTAGVKADYERFEDIEILRFFDLGFPIRMVELRATQAVDVPSDVALVEKALGI